LLPPSVSSITHQRIITALLLAHAANLLPVRLLLLHCLQLCLLLVLLGILLLLPRWLCLLCYAQHCIFKHPVADDKDTAIFTQPMVNAFT
jgi:hypothetical protein